MNSSEHRPRSLRWFHAGPLLFGDWGTSRLYVLGLAFYYTGHASSIFLLAMSVLMAAVAWAYTVVCRCFPDGGGVYTAARRLSPILAVIGGTLLLCDYIVTASLSGIEAMHYMGVPGKLVVGSFLGMLGLVGVVNWLGAKSAGRFALVVAVLAILTSAFLAVLCIPFLPKGFRAITTGHASLGGFWPQWTSLVRIVLALSGIEAVANMTGLMTQPVAKTARRTIWLVLIEVVVLNMIFGVAIGAMPTLAPTHKPDYVAYEVEQRLDSDQVPEQVREYRDTAVKVLAFETATHAFGPRLGKVIGFTSAIIFGLLLLSAVNTAVMALVSVMFSMAQDGELPRSFRKLNYSGVPVVPLAVSLIVPAAVVLVEADVKSLSELYSIGVVGAITINLLACAANRSLAIGKIERMGLWGLGSLMGVIELTIVVAKPNATIFASSIIAAVLGLRFATRLTLKRRVEAALPEPELGWLNEIAGKPVRVAPGQARMMLAARGRDQAEFAVNLAASRQAVLFAIFVRPLRVLDLQPGMVPKLDSDREAQQALGTVALIARQRGVPFFPIYVASSDIPAEILDYTVTFGCDTLILGKSQRTLFARKVAGDVVNQIAAALPQGVSLITRAPGDAGPAR